MLRHIILAAVGVAVSLGCFRLSKWQLDRLAQRRERNVLLAERLGAEPMTVGQVPSDTAQGRYRRVKASGAFDFSREVALILRSRHGAPGVHVITPLRLSDGREILANRGWVYAPDGMTLDFERWRDDTVFNGEGFLETYAAPRGALRPPDRPQAVRRLVRDSLASLLGPEAVAIPYVLTLTSLAGENAPTRLAPPSLSEGPHLSYAIQWAVFGLIALAGIVLALRQGTAARHKTGGTPGRIN
ncbi:MAG: SURF1 family protein [Gemmatimonadaceae bacterium]